MKKTGQLATKNKSNAVQANKKNTPKKGLITPKKVQPTGKGKGVGGKQLPAKKGKNSTKKEKEEPEDDSELELNNMQENSVESNGIVNGATNGSDAPDDSSSDDDDDGISGNARQLFGKILPKIQSTSDDDDDQEGEGEDSEEENEVNPIKNQSKQEDDEEDDDDEEQDDDDEEEEEQDEDDDEEEKGNEQNNEDEDEDEEDDDSPDEENIKKEYPKEDIDLWQKKETTAKDKDQSVDSLQKRQCTVYVLRLKNRTTEEDIKTHFKSIGEIKTVKFEKRAYFPSAVVTFADVASSKAALKMNNTILNDCTILVRHAQAPKTSSKDKECTILLVNVDKLEKLEGERLEKIFSKVGEIEELSVICQPNVLAFVTFKTQEAATEALKLDGTVQDDLKIHVKPDNSSKPKTRIFITNISANATEDDLRKMFEPCGQINHITLKRNQFGVTCDLKFDTEESFCKSFLLHDEMLLGKPLNVRPFSQFKLPRKPFQKNEPNSSPFQGNKPSSRGSFRGNWSNSRGSFKGNRPNSGQFNGKRQFPGPFDGQRSQSLNMWASEPPQKKTKIGMTKTQPANE